VLSVETSGRVLESLCLGRSPKGPWQLMAGGGGRGWEWGKRRIPTRFTEQTSQPFVRPPFSVRMATALAQSHFLRAEPREQRCPRRGTASPCPPPCPRARPQPSSASPGVAARCHRQFGLILRSQAMPPCPRRRSGHGWHGCRGTRNSLGKRFLTPLPIPAARARHVPALPHSPPQTFSVSPPMNVSLGLKRWDTAGTGVSCGYWKRTRASNAHQASEVPPPHLPTP